MPDIDAEDVGNQLAVVDFVEDIYAFYRKTEVKKKRIYETHLSSV